MKPRPFRFNPKLASRNTRLRRLKRIGLTPPIDKASQRQAAADACTKHAITIIPSGKRSRSKPFDAMD